MKQIFINLPVADVENSMHLYAELGFSNYPLFSDDQQKCMVWSDSIYVMLIAREKFINYSGKILSDSKSKIDAYFTLPVENLERVNEIVENGLKAGGSEPMPMKDEGFMQIRKIQDLDGHVWDIIHLDIDKFKTLQNV